LRSLVAEAEAACAPAAPDEIALVLTRLFAHYPQTNAPGAIAELRWDDWIEDMAHVPAAVLRAGCKAWRTSPQRFAPTPGQLLDVMAEAMGYRRAYLRRAKAVLADVEARS
jgi:hypothetical protein